MLGNFKGRYIFIDCSIEGYRMLSDFKGRYIFVDCNIYVSFCDDYCFYYWGDLNYYLW